MSARPAPAEGWRPISPEALLDALAERFVGPPGLARVLLDGPPCAAPDELAEALLDRVQALGRPAVHVRADRFWHDASLRLEHGREDDGSLPAWLDAAALCRELLDPIARRGEYLPSLRDPVTNRATREPVRTAGPGTVLLVSGAFLLGRGLPAEHTVHLAVSPAARARRTAPGQAWTLPAFERYDEDVRPAVVADVVVKLDDPRHPAVRGV